MTVQSAFDARGTWYRGNLHTHSSRSDARLTPAEVVEFYRTNGYDFIGLTDHLIYANPADWEAHSEFLVIPGIENHGEDPESGVYHLVGLGGNMAPATRCQPLNSLRGETERLLSHGHAGALRPSLLVGPAGATSGGDRWAGGRRGV